MLAARHIVKVEGAIVKDGRYLMVFRGQEEEVGLGGPR